MDIYVVAATYSKPSGVKSRAEPVVRTIIRTVIAESVAEAHKLVTHHILNSNRVTYKKAKVVSVASLTAEGLFSSKQRL